MLRAGQEGLAPDLWKLLVHQQMEVGGPGGSGFHGCGNKEAWQADPGARGGVLETGCLRQVFSLPIGTWGQALSSHWHLPWFIATHPLMLLSSKYVYCLPRGHDTVSDNSPAGVPRCIGAAPPTLTWLNCGSHLIPALLLRLRLSLQTIFRSPEVGLSRCPLELTMSLKLVG